MLCLNDCRYIFAATFGVNMKYIHRGFIEKLIVSAVLRLTIFKYNGNRLTVVDDECVVLIG